MNIILLVNLPKNKTLQKNKIFVFLISLIFLSGFLYCQTSFAAQNSTIKKQAKNNIIITKIKSNFINLKRSQEIAYFYGNVIVEREDLSILADKMAVYYGKSNKDQKSNKLLNKKSQKSQAIKKIIVQNNVKIFNEEFVATGEYGVYDPEQNNFILKNNVIFNQGVSVAKGEKFIYNLATKKGNLVGKTNNDSKINDNRVIVIIEDSSLKDSK